MSEQIVITIVGVAIGALLAIIGTLMIRSNNRVAEMTKGLEVEVDAARAELTRLVTQVAVQGTNHGHIQERLAVNEQAVASLHRRVDNHQDRLTKIEARAT